MSSSASPSTAPSAEYAEHLSHLVVVPSLSHENHYFLGPIGNLDPTNFIIGETNRILFRLANPNLGHWKNTFKLWPSLEKTTPEKSWTTSYQCVSATKKVHWDEIWISQVLALTIANSTKDKPLMAAATYFWSHTINAFLLNQGPMTPNLIDITMITGLDVTSSANPMSMNTKNQFDFRTKSIGAEALESEKQFPLGKILLGYLYQTLNNASAKIAVGSVVGAGGPWCLLQTWLNLMVMKVVNRPSVTEAEFPFPEPIVGVDGKERTHRRCTSYGEYASSPTDPGAKLSAELLKDWFCSFYEGFQKDARVWFPYEDSADLELPSDFRFEDINHEKYQKSREVLTAAISPCILPVGIHQGRNIQIYSLMSYPRDIEYALGLIPNGGGPSPPVIGYHAPMTLTLLQGLIREPADVGNKRKTRSSAVGTLALAPKKKAKSKKTKPTDKPTDDLPALDPSIEQALDEEEIGEDVDQAKAEKKKTAVKKKPAAIIVKSAPPQSSSDRALSTVGSHHIEEEEQPAAPTIPVLVDLFSFDIGDYLDEAEEDISSKALAPLSDDVKKTVEDISRWLEASSLDSLVVDCGSIRTRLHEVQALIPEELADVLTPAAYLEQHQFKLKKAKLRLAERRERKEIEATIQVNRQLMHEEKVKLDQLSEGPINSNINRLEARKIDLLAQLEECNAELDMDHKKLADLPKSVEEQKARLKSAIKNVADMTKSLKVIFGTDAQDAQAIEEVEQIRQRAILAIQQYLSQ
uniref:DUF1409 domain-containing protein n=1 Tax=Oryza sativa subsp. japonica TaxID=39947 RepID=Q2QS26_ORYSJ|nr:hypothetical protein LOC_Os12g25570 [Oryza sativa Japonica Group]